MHFATEPLEDRLDPPSARLTPFTVPAPGEVTDLLIRAEQLAALIGGPHPEVMAALVRGVVAVASVQLQYAITGEQQAGENARQLLSSVTDNLRSPYRYPGMTVPAELFDVLHQLALAGRAYSGR